MTDPDLPLIPSLTLRQTEGHMDPYIGRVIPESDLKRLLAIEEAAKALCVVDLGLIGVREVVVKALREALDLPHTSS